MVVVCGFQEIGPFYQSCKVCIPGFVQSIPCYPHDVCRACNDILYFISDVSRLCVLSVFFFAKLVQDCQFLKNLSKEPALFFLKKLILLLSF